MSHIIDKQCNIVMLPTNKSEIAKRNARIPSIVHSSTIGAKDGFIKQGFYVPQHLYITSDDEIKGGDWFICNSILKYCTYKGKTTSNITYLVDKLGNEDNISFCKKIIATTDKSLKEIIHRDISYHSPNVEISLPQIPQDFIKKFCEQGGIDKVLVEYQKNSQFGSFGLYNYNVKTDSHNTITIKPVKERTYSKTEVQILFGDFAQEFNLLDSKENISEYNEWMNSKNL